MTDRIGEDPRLHEPEIQWDGWQYPYVPRPNLRIPETLRLHDKADDSVDLITHEVLRHALWNVNLEHGKTITRVSGSPAAAFGHDFNSVLLDERGGFVYNGPYIQYLSAAANCAVKWTIENRGENPGIEPGDAFFTNDPWIGTDHQPDVVIIHPVFVNNELFCWTGNSLHTWDLGGTAPGGFNPEAVDVYWESICVPPVKLVEHGRIRADIESMILRSSRLPDLVALDLRALITGARVAGENIRRLVDQHGASTVKATMRKIQDDSERAFRERLATIPDGSWAEEGWLECANPGDRNVYRNRVTLTKREEKLIFTNYGSHEQVGVLNATFPAWCGGILSMVSVQMLFDQMFALEGALRCCEFRVEPGTISCATRPAAVSGASVTPMLNTIGLTGLAISRMLATSSDEELRTEVQSAMGAMSGASNVLQGIDQRGHPYVSFLMDAVGAALPAKNWSDGQDTGGFAFDLQSTMPNVEDAEFRFPVLYLWRKELPDSGGAGVFRGGNSGQRAVMPHRTDRIVYSTLGSEFCVPGAGLFGGYPTSTNSYRHYRAIAPGVYPFRDGRTPTSVEELTPDPTYVPAKSAGNVLLPGEVLVFSWPSASGYGDPLLREIEAVQADIDAGRVTTGWARIAYGVVHGDPLATEKLRYERFRARLAGQDPRYDQPVIAATAASLPITELLVELRGRLVCRRCGRDICAQAEDYRSHLLSHNGPVQGFNPNLHDPKRFTDLSVEVFEYYCTGCGVLIDADVVVGEQHPDRHIRLGEIDPERLRYRLGPVGGTR